MRIELLLVSVGVCCAYRWSQNEVQECTCTCTDWEDCKSPKKCTEKTAAKTMSYSAGRPRGLGELDVGRVRMRKMMRDKKRLWASQMRSRSGVTRRSEGRVDCFEGMAKDLPCRNVHQVAFLDFKDLTDGDANFANDIWGWTDPETQDEYAIVGFNCGTSFVKLTPNPEQPTVLAYLPTASSCSSWRDIKVVNDHAFIVSEASAHGMQVFDLSRLRKMNNYSVVYADVTIEHFGKAHNVVGNDETDFIYVVGATERTAYTCDGGLLIYEVTHPVQPEYVGCNGQDGYTHDAQCVVYNGPDANYIGKEICFLYNEDTFTIFDVTDKKKQKLLSRQSYDGFGYTHQGWLTEDHSTVLLDDELDEERTKNDSNTKTYIWDVSDLNNIELVNIYVSQLTVIDHNMYIKGDLCFQSNYMGGLRVLHINQEEYDLTEVGYFDLYPEADEPRFSGTWSNYPYFPSGNVVVTSMRSGLYVVHPDYEAMEAAATDTTYGEQTRYCNDKKQVRTCVAEECP